MIEKLYRFRIKRKIIGVFIVEKMNRVSVKFEAERFQEQNVIAHYVFVGEIEFMHNYRVDMIIAEQIICKM